MLKVFFYTSIVCFMLISGFSCQANLENKTSPAVKNQYEDLIALFNEFRLLQKPNITNGVPDYTPQAMKKQHRQLQKLRKQLDKMDISGWPVSQKVDYHLVRAELNGLDFNHRILRPWSRDPGFYSITGRFEQTQQAAFRIPSLPIDKDKIEQFQIQLQAVPAILSQAKSNLTEPAADLATLAIRRKQQEGQRFKRLIENLQQHHPDLIPDAQKALAAIEDFRDWLEKNKSQMAASAAIGIDNYNWLLKNVYLFPYTWQDCLAISQREYERCIARLKWEEHRNRNLPPLTPAATADEYTGSLSSSLLFLQNFLRENNILPENDYLKLRNYTKRNPPEKPDLFQHIMIRDPLPLHPHDFVGHAPDEARIPDQNNPIRKGYKLFHISGIRAEALATGAEEMLMHTGFLDQRPRSRELIYMLRIFRAVRSIADLRMHSGQMSLKQAIQYCAENVPYGWVEQDSNLIWTDLELYIRQPGYGMGYLVGAVNFEKLIADRALQLGDDFTIRRFMTEFLDSGMIPLSLIRWEMMGLDDELRKLR